MKRIIGLVCEGPRDYDLLQDLIDSFFPEDEIECRLLQPDPSLQSANFNGWKGVLRWCRRDYRDLIDSNPAMQDPLNLLVIQLDGDVSRAKKNRQSHCMCRQEECPGRERYTEDGLVRIEDCSIENCPVHMPCTKHGEGCPQQYAEHCKNLLKTIIQEREAVPVIITIPCDSMDTWIVAAFEEDDIKYEEIKDPWDHIITKGPTYHGIRISGKKKNKASYSKLRKAVVENWDIVKQRCEQADQFQKDLQAHLLTNPKEKQ